jgi:predicted O-methyltransferase YrrM
MSRLSGLWTRILTGDGLRKSRLHTYSGQLVDAGGLAYLPRAAWSVILLKVFGYRQKFPWLGYRAVKYLDSIIKPDWNVLEFGSGMSSLFFASRCKRLVSIESDRAWFEEMQQIFVKEGLANVDYRFRTIDEYAVIPDLADRSFDLIIVDGLIRDQCAKVALEKVKPGGVIFLDNSDVPWTEFVEARKTLVQAAGPDGVRVFNDFCPFQIQVNQSLSARIRHPDADPSQT